MRLHGIFLTCLVAPLPGCGGSDTCDQQTETFFIDVALTQGELAEVGFQEVDERYYGCADLCEIYYRATRDGYVDEIRSCDYDLDVPAFDTADSGEDAAVGHLSCTGIGVSCYG